MYFGSHSAIPAFRLERPTTIAAALRAKAAAGESGAYLAGGVDLVPAMRDGRARVETLIALGGIDELRAIEVQPRAIRIGALVTYRQIETDPMIGEALPDLAQIWTGIGNIRVRHAATVGGNLMARDANYDLMPVLLALGATVITAELKGSGIALRAQPVGEPIATGALLCAVEIARKASRRFAMDRSMKPVVNLALALERDTGEIRVGFGCIGGVYAAHAVSRSPRTSAKQLAENLVAQAPQPISDAQASGGYRRKLMAVLTARLLARLDVDA